ncbi:hypothetical protein QZH41_010140 [Actinostola sp. cb2023]|nr:hypothetical protein QZH41_010140 [Actinostola sp. cb2023]
MESKSHSCHGNDELPHGERFNQKDFKIYQIIQELLLKAVAGEDHSEELAKVMAVYGDTDLQQYNLEPQLSFLPGIVQAMGFARLATALEVVVVIVVVVVLVVVAVVVEMIMMVVVVVVVHG